MPILPADVSGRPELPTHNELKLSAVAKPSADVLVVGAAADGEGVKVLGADEAGISSAVAASLNTLGFKGKQDATLALPVDGKVVIFAGLGKVPEEGAKLESLRRAAGAAVRAAAGLGNVKSVAIALPAASAEAVQAIAEGASLGSYTWTAFKSKDSGKPIEAVEVVTSASGAEDAIKRADIVARHVKHARDLVNTPPNDLYPATFADVAVAAGKKLEGVDVEVWDIDRLRKENMGGILGVGKGSEKEPRFVIVSYTPAGGENAKRVAIVGKGVTFDSGGLSLKPSAKMHEMKSDMGGAAATLHAVLAAAELKLPVRVTGYLCLAENMPSGSALKNADVIRQRNGLTTEIHNTDAEGRLVLADGLSVAVESNPDLLFNIATLTGAQLVALGMRTAAVMGDDPAVEAIKKASAEAGENFWAMPLPEEMLEDLKSTTADFKNIGSIPWGGMCKAGVFLQQFAGDKNNWAHLDIAGPSANFGAPYGYTTAEGTGFGVRTLVKAAEHLGAQ
ncbi:hypothetical protein VHUM_03079 [Vanrija humicola]|uniref:Cytosol aminopeptidase domain-containing protein n=1 Tax=Vanrija humicola TaxID=5417 RepID=A0A7D8YWS9_VANHU|nr:hypothetical protein VHUM_03079 [Vanrija humicola]